MRVTSTMAPMANHPRRNWRKQWTVDLAARLARHEPTGTVIHFGELDPGPSPQVVRTLVQQHGAAAAVQMVQRLVREATEVYQRAKSNRGHQETS